ncbi:MULTISPECIES: O-antigen polymerase [unclassified Moorena]|uniref:O-antigen polymerase n=1 Tax=unclassified Moorena TaxID=2683338 RepID=UPI0013FF8D04|nr:MULTISPECIES: O-antigen polymerase [unclassified Moorena]NEO11010.1 oligosaccharide repeat unit polymerase [Moorena sp. SIO3E8]NEP99124.1 oligosaccharide repeat unit polymerase [Moorena sp. SIO3F7]
MLSITYLLLFFAVVFVETTRKKANLLDFLTFFNLNFVLFYIFPGFIFSRIAESPSSYAFDFQSNLQIVISIYLGYFLVLIGFYSKSSTQLAKIIYIRKTNEKKLIKIAIFFIVFSFFSVLIYSAQYGGFSNALSQSSAIRSGLVEGGSLVLFKNFFDCAEYASYLFASLAFFGKNTKNKLILYLFLGLSIALTVITILLKSSRSSIIRYFISFVLAYIIERQKFPWLSIIIGVFFAIAVILYGDPFFASLSSIPEGYDSFIGNFSSRLEHQASTSTESNFEEDLAGDFSYTLKSLDTSFNNEYEFQWFSDFIFGFMTLIPERLIPIETPQSVTSINTFLAFGHNEWSFIPGFLALGIYSMSWMGLIMLCISYGWLGRYLQTILTKDKNYPPWVSFLYVVVMNVWSSLLSGGNPGGIIKGSAVFFLSIIFIFYVSKRKIKKF